MNSLHSQNYDDQDLDFLDAINSDEIPRPTKKWRSPTLAEVESCVDLTRKITPEALELEEICKNTLGFYLVRVLLQYIFCAKVLQCVKCSFVNT